jgi:putative nucleotidyltransferase-like protein
MAKKIQTSGHRLGAFLGRAESLKQPNDFADLASNELVAAFFLYRLREEGIQPQDFPELQPLIDEARQFAAQYMLQEHAMLEVNQALSDANIKAIWLKGAALAHTIYPQATLRSKSDLDLIVSIGDFRAALRILKDLDYYEPEKHLKTTAQDLMSHHAHLRHSKFNLIILELHHRLLGHTGQGLMPAHILEKWLEQTIEFDVNGQSCHTLKPETHFIYICAHVFLQHGEVSLTLRDLLDLHLLTVAYDLDWDEIVNQSIALGWTYLLEKALEHLQEYLQTAIPQEVLDAIRAGKSSDREIRDRIILKSSGDIRGESVLQLFRHLTLWERIQTIWQIAVPSEAYMRVRYDVSGKRSVLPYYFYRWFDQSRGLMIALVRRVANRMGKIIRR